MCATVQEIMNGNHLWNDGMMKGNTICPQLFHGGGIKKAENQINILIETLHLVCHVIIITLRVTFSFYT
jgi:hypothetical protein